MSSYHRIEDGGRPLPDPPQPENTVAAHGAATLKSRRGRGPIDRGVPGCARLRPPVHENHGSRRSVNAYSTAPELLKSRETPASTRIAVRRCLRELRTPRALTWARANANFDDAVGSTALSLFAGLAETSDAPRLLEFLTEAVRCGNDYIYDQCELVTALGRLNHSAGATTVDQIFEDTVYSYLRRLCAVSLSRSTPNFAHTRAIECLDDCESGARPLTGSCRSASGFTEQDKYLLRIFPVARQPSHERSCWHTGSRRSTQRSAAVDINDAVHAASAPVTWLSR